MDNFEAVTIAEAGEDTEGRVFEAWQHLVDTGLCWKLQGWFGRNALHLIREELINPPPGYFLNSRGKLERNPEY